MRRCQSKRGFTLVELIIVISVLAVLAAIAVPIAGSVMASANTSSDQANLEMYQSAIEKFVATPVANVPAGGGGAYPLTPAAALVAIRNFSRIPAGLLAQGKGPAPNHFVYTYTAAAGANPASGIVSMGAAAQANFSN